VLSLTRLLVSRLRVRLGATVVRPSTYRERERLLVLRCVNWLLYFVAAVLVIVMLPGPGRRIGTLLIALTLFVVLIAARRTLENIAAGFTVGRIAGARRGARIRCGDCQGLVEEWTLTGLRIRDDQGFLVHLPYRVCEEAPMMIDDPEEGRA
jgi:small-conductance mechanosensitive channel